MFRLFHRHFCCVTQPTQFLLTFQRQIKCIKQYSVLVIGQLKCLPRQSSVRFASRMERTRRPVDPKFDRDIEVDVSKDIKVFTNSRTGFFKGIILIGLVQTVMWTQLAHFSIHYLHDEPSLEPRTGWKDSWLFRNKYRVSVCLVCCLAGIVALFFSLSYPVRSIKQMWLLKGGENIRLVTFSPVSFGQYNKKLINVPLSDVSAQLSRDQKNNTIPIKIKGYRFHFLLDNKSGTFHEPGLYDYTIGLKRNLN